MQAGILDDFASMFSKPEEITLPFKRDFALLLILALKAFSIRVVMEVTFPRCHLAYPTSVSGYCLRYLFKGD